MSVETWGWLYLFVMIFLVPAPISIVINLALMFAMGLFWALGGFQE